MRLLASIAVACAPLAACAGTPSVDLCKGAETRRQIYTAAIIAADAYAASGRPVPTAIADGRAAAVIALALLDAHCPRKAD